MNASVKFEVTATANKTRDFVMQPPQPLDRITFNTPDDGVMAGYVSVIRQHLGNGERFAWVELDNEPAGFRGVPLAAIISCDDSDLSRRADRNPTSVHHLYLANFSARAVGFV